MPHFPTFCSPADPLTPRSCKVVRKTLTWGFFDLFWLGLFFFFLTNHRGNVFVGISPQVGFAAVRSTAVTLTTCFVPEESIVGCGMRGKVLKFYDLRSCTYNVSKLCV